MTTEGSTPLLSSTAVQFSIGEDLPPVRDAKVHGGNVVRAASGSIAKWQGTELQPLHPPFDPEWNLNAPKVFVAARDLAKVQERVQLSLGAQRSF